MRSGIGSTLGIFEFFPQKLKFLEIPENPHSIDEYLDLSKMLIGGQQGWPYKNQIEGVIYPYLPILNSSLEK